MAKAKPGRLALPVNEFEEGEFDGVLIEAQTASDDGGN